MQDEAPQDRGSGEDATPPAVPPAGTQPALPQPGSRPWLMAVLSRWPVSSALLGGWALWALVAFGQAVVYTPGSGRGEPDYMPLLTFCWLTLGFTVAQFVGLSGRPTDPDAPMDAAQDLAAARRRAVRRTVGVGWFYGLGVATALSAFDLGGATRAQEWLRIAELAAEAGGLASAVAMIRSGWFARRYPRLSRVLTGRLLRRRPEKQPRQLPYRSREQ